MKKFKFILPVMFLVSIGLVLLACASDPDDPPPPIEDFDIEFKGGKYDHVFETPKIEDGKTYEVILTIEKCDDRFIGSQLGGKICYSDEADNEYVLSGWSNPVPAAVSSAKTYKWTFKAGEKNSDSLDPVSPATTPAGGKQYFHFEAQTSDWKPYGPNDNFRIKGGFVVNAKEVPSEWTSEGTVTLGNADGIAGKGTLSSTDSAQIRDLPAGSKIVITVTVNVNAAGAGSNEPGWGVGSVGGWTTSDSVSINIPGSASAGELTFDCEIEVSDIETVFPTGDISINLYNGATASKLELFRPTNAVSTTWVSAGEVTLGNADGVAGKGTFSDADMAIIDSLPANSKIRIDVEGVNVGEVGSGSSEPGWGVGSIGGWVSKKDPEDPDAPDVDSVAINIPGNTTPGEDRSFTVEIKISDIRAAFPSGSISINIWNGIVTKAELFKLQ